MNPGLAFHLWPGDKPAPQRARRRQSASAPPPPTGFLLDPAPAPSPSPIAVRPYRPPETALDGDTIDPNRPALSHDQNTNPFSELLGDWLGHRVFDEAQDRLPGWGAARGGAGISDLRLPALSGDAAQTPDEVEIDRQALPGRRPPVMAEAGAGKNPWAELEQSTDGKGTVVFKDERMPPPRLKEEVATAYLAMLDDPRSTSGDAIAFAKRHGFEIDADQVKTFFVNRAAGVRRGPLSYQSMPRLLIDMKDGATGAAARGVADGVFPNMLDEAGGVVDTLVPGERRPNIWDGDGRRFGDKLWDNIDTNRAILGHDQKYHPYARFGGQMAGGAILPGGATEGLFYQVARNALLRNATRAEAIAAARAAVSRRLAQAAAAEGAVAGAGGAEGGLPDRLPGAVLGGATGLMLGYAGGELGQPIVDAVRSRVRAKWRGNTPFGARPTGESPDVRPPLGGVHARLLAASPQQNVQGTVSRSSLSPVGVVDQFDTGRGPPPPTGFVLDPPPPAVRSGRLGDRPPAEDLAANIILRVPDDASNAAARADEAAAITDKAPAAEAASTGETIATARGKSAHSSFATGRRESGDFSLVNAPFRDANGHPLQLPKRVDLLNGTPAPNTSLGTVRPDAVRFSNGVIVEDKPLGRALSKDRQQIIRYINGYQQARGELPARVGIQRYDPTTGEPVMTELHSPFDFLPKD